MLRLGAVLVAALLAMAMALAMVRTGPWYDEFFTLVVTRPGVPFAELFARHWLADNHPPLFYGLAWATNWLGENAQPRRLLNLAFLTLAAATFVRLARRDPERQVLLACYALGLASCLPAILYAAELRSNYLALVSSSVALAVLALTAIPRERGGRFDGASVFLALLVAFNVHFITTVLVGAIVLAFTARLLLVRKGTAALRLVALAALAALPLAITTGLQIANIEANTRSFWIPSGFTAARWAVQHVLLDIIIANVPLTLGGVAGIVLAIHDGRRWEPIALAAILMTGIALGLTALLTLHLWRPVVIERYLVALFPAAMMALAAGAAYLLTRLRPVAAGLWGAAIVIAAAVAIVWNLQTAAGRLSWFGTGRYIAEMVRQCPDTAVHANMDWNRPVLDMPPGDNRGAMPFGYASVARQLDFGLEPKGSRRMSGHCPTLFWTEHVSNLSPSANEIAARLRTRGFAVGRARLHRIGQGWVLVAEPLRRPNS